MDNLRMNGDKTLADDPRVALNAAGTYVTGPHLLDPTRDSSMYPTDGELGTDMPMDARALELSEPDLGFVNAPEPATIAPTIAEPALPVMPLPTVESRLSNRSLQESQFIDNAELGPEMDPMASPADDGGIAVPSIDAQYMLAGSVLPGERVVHLATISGGIYWKSIAMALLAVVTMFYTFTLAFYFLGVAAIMALLAWSTQRALMLAATDKRIIIRAGIMSMQTVEIPFSRIESVDVMTTPMGMLLGFSSVIILGTGGMRYIVPFIRDANAFRDDFSQWMLARENAVVQ